jgi:hypothetical protein
MILYAPVAACWISHALKLRHRVVFLLCLIQPRCLHRDQGIVLSISVHNIPLFGVGRPA